MDRPQNAAPWHNIICDIFSRNFQADNSSLRVYIKDLQAGISVLREFVTIGEAGFSALRGERVNLRWSASSDRIARLSQTDGTDEPWNDHLRSLKVIRCCANRRGVYNFLLALSSNLTSVFNRSWDITPSLHIHTPPLFPIELEKDVWEYVDML